MARKPAGMGGAGRQRAFDRINEALQERPGVDVDSPTENVIQVTPDNIPELWGQGPTKSTRVASHKFVPNTAETPEDLLRGVSGIPLGTVYVEFWKPGRMGTQWAYRNVPFPVYSDFTRSKSKGHFINSTLNNYDYGPEAW